MSELLIVLGFLAAGGAQAAGEKAASGPEQGAAATAEVATTVLAELPETGDPVVETAVAADGASVAFVTRGEDGDTLWFAGDRKANCEEIGHVSLTPDGPVWWCRTGGEHTVYFGESSSGPFLDISMPNLDALAALAAPTPVEWGYRAGSRSVLAARDARGEWQSYFRYSAAPSVQEKRGLPMTLSVASGPDASVQKARGIRYHLVAGRLPLFIGTSKREECIYLGSDAVGCGQQVAMLAWSAATQRLAFAVTTSEGLMVYSGGQVWGPTRNLDWVAFSPDGTHLAFVIREGEQQALVVDDERKASFSVLESVVWTPDNRLVYLGHDDAGAHLVVDGQEVLLRDLVSAVYVSPTGAVSASGRHKGKSFVYPEVAGLEDFDSLWGEGFLSGGGLYGLLRLAGGRQALLLAGRLSAPFDGLSRLTPSLDGRKLAAVASTPSGDRLLVDLEEQSAERAGRAEQLTWCGNDRVLVRERSGDQDCTFRSDDPKAAFCCARMVMVACGATGEPDTVCLDQGKYWLHKAGTKEGEPYDEIPPHLIWQDLTGGTFDFAARRGADWFLVTGGKERPAGGRPLTIRPFLDSPWFLVSGAGGSRWMTRAGDGPWFATVSPPFDLAGMAVYRGRSKGAEWWVLPSGQSAPAVELLSGPMAFDGGMAWWERAGGKRRLASLRLTAKENDARDP